MVGFRLERLGKLPSLDWLAAMGQTICVARVRPSIYREYQSKLFAGLGGAPPATVGCVSSATGENRVVMNSI
jgi:hypothetical protein